MTEIIKHKRETNTSRATRNQSPDLTNTKGKKKLKS